MIRASSSFGDRSFLESKSFSSGSWSMFFVDNLASLELEEEEEELEDDDDDDDDDDDGMGLRRC